MSTASENATDLVGGAAVKRDLRGQLEVECEAMMRYAFASGIRVPSEIGLQVSGFAPEPRDTVGSGQPADPKRLVETHNQLAALVAPATPRTILYATSAKPGLLGNFGAIPLLRQLALMAWMALGVLVGAVTSGYAGSGTPGSMAASNAVGVVVVVNQLFFAAAATLGACFFALFKAQRYVGKTTFDPLYIPVYWTRVVLGVLAGMILANFLSIDGVIGLVPDHLERVSVALLGGFSADAVFTILTRLVEAFNSLVQGSGSDAVAAEKQKCESRLNQERDRNKLSRANELISLRNKLSSAGDAKELEANVNQLIEKNLNS